MRRRAIPPLCGGAVQALPNFQTTLRDHPHPASRPMTFGHFTSWHADDLGYYTGAWTTTTTTTTTTRRRAHVARMVFFARDCGPWQAREGRWKIAKVARASSCNINVENHWFFRIRTARADRNCENSCRCFSMTYGAIRVIL